MILRRLCVWLGVLGLVVAGRDGVRAPPARGVTCVELAGSNPWEDRLGGRTLADRGALLGCTHAASFTRDQVAQSPLSALAGRAPISGYELFVIQYVSEGRPGEARAVSALLYLPSDAPDGVPIVAVEHGTSGIGPACGPSHVPVLVDAMAVPLAGQGHAVIAPDYAGMGVDNGMTSYLVGTAEAAATLDGVRALRQLHDPRFDAAQLGQDFFVAGHSQGGHAALFTHQLFDPSLGVRFLGSIAMAPGLGSVRGWARFFDRPSRPVGFMETLALLSLYAHMLHAGGPAPETWLTPAAQAALPAMLHDQCLLTLPFSLPARFPLLSDLYRPSFLAEAARCDFDGPCPAFEPWASMLAAEQPGRIASDVPSLLLQGLADAAVPPSSVACIADRMRARGTPVQVCGYAGMDHLGVIGAALPDMMRWMAGRRAGETPDVCRTPMVAAPCVGQERPSP